MRERGRRKGEVAKEDACGRKKTASGQSSGIILRHIISSKEKGCTIRERNQLKSL